MKRLILVRHAKAKAGEPDGDRKLSKRGRKQARRIGEYWRAECNAPRYMIASPAVRAFDTADIAANTAFDGGENPAVICADDRLYLSGVEQHLAALREIPDEHGAAAAFGHNPDLEYLVHALTGESIAMPTGSFAAVELHIDNWGHLHPGGHRLESFMDESGLDSSERCRLSGAVRAELEAALSLKQLRKIAAQIGSRKKFRKTLNKQLTKAKKPKKSATAECAG